MVEVVDRDRIKRRLTEMAAYWRQQIDKWREKGTESGTEKRYAQQFWSDLMKSFGIIPERVSVFERNANRASTGGHGYIDFFWSGVVIGEAKSLGVNLSHGYSQVIDYLNGADFNSPRSTRDKSKAIQKHEWPRFIIVTNFEQFKLERLGEESWTHEFTIDELPDYMEQLMFFAGIETVTKREQEEASIEAAKLMANLFNTLVGEDADENVGEEAPMTQEEEDDEIELASILMTRLLFLMYGDDAGLWEEDLFYRWVESVNSKNLGPALDGLFQILNADENTRRRRFRNLSDLESRFPYVNGGIFDGSAQVGYSVPADFKDALLDAARFRWTQISPAIFGSMFQLVKSKEARRGDGEHYTSEKNILKTIGPLFLDEYRERADRLIANKSTRPKDLQAFQEEIASNIYIDPACGAGNFLNVAYSKLREIETDIIVELRKRQGESTGLLDATMNQLLTIDKFYGIEINWWPAKIAETAMFLVDHQANRELAARTGVAPERLPITITATIVHENALTIDWKEVFPTPTGETFVFGNPPFIGQYGKTKEQTADMKRVWGADYDGYLDYVTAWHAKSLDLLSKRSGEFAYVTTNSITQGQPVPALFSPIFRKGWKIKFAHKTFSWDSEAPGKAAVHCVIVGFSRKLTRPPALWDYEKAQGAPTQVKVHDSINAYLIDGPNVLVTKRAKPLSPEISPAHYGTKLVDQGHLIVEKTEVDDVRNDPVASKYLRPLVGARELVQGLQRWCLWMGDETFDPRDIAKSKILQERVTAVKKFRENATPSGDAYKLRQTPHLFRPNENRPTTDYLCVPSVVSESRPFITAEVLDPTVIATNSVFTIPDPDGLQFGLISSSMFMAWQRAIGGRLKSDIRFANTLSWNNFPVPKLDSSTTQEIVQAAKDIRHARKAEPDASLSVLYSPLAMSKPLVNAHNHLDSVVDKAFGARRKINNESQRLEILFQQYHALSVNQE